MTENFSISFNSIKYPDGTVRSQFKIDFQVRPKTANISSVYQNEINKRMAKLITQDRKLVSKLMREQKNYYK